MEVRGRSTFDKRELLGLVELMGLLNYPWKDEPE
jgi:hypothetical protein